jgi:HK97 gp10 family phage protein
VARNITVQGLGKLQANLAKCALLTHMAAEKAVKEEVGAIGDDARAGVPVRSGEARDGIREQSSGTEGSVDATARHSKFIELGTYKDQAQPFMAPAAEKSRLRWPLRAANLIKSHLEGGIR